MDEIEYFNKIITQSDLTKEKDVKYCLENCSSEECLTVPNGTYVSRSKFKMLFADVWAQPSLYKNDVCNLHISESEVDLIRTGPYGWIWLSSKSDNTNKINRLIMEGELKGCSNSRIKLLHIFRGGSAWIQEGAEIDNLTCYGVATIESSANVKGFCLYPGGILKFKEDEESPHLDISSMRPPHKERVKVRNIWYTILFG